MSNDANEAFRIKNNRQQHYTHQHRHQCKKPSTTNGGICKRRSRQHGLGHTSGLIAEPDVCDAWCIRDNLPAHRGYVASAYQAQRLQALLTLLQKPTQKMPLSRSSGGNSAPGGGVSYVRTPTSKVSMSHRSRSRGDVCLGQAAAAHNHPELPNIIRPERNHLLETGSTVNLYFEFGDSLARCGRLHEAFDIYAFIASNYLDGYIPLDRLNTLASSLIDYIRQMDSRNTASSGSSDSTATFLQPSYIGVRYDEVNDDSIDDDDEGADITMATPSKQRHSKKSASLHDNQRHWKTARGLGEDKINPVRDMATDSKLVSQSPQKPKRTQSPWTMTAADGDFDALLCPVCKDILRCPVTANCGHTFCRQCCDGISMCVLCRVKFPQTVSKSPLPQTPTATTGEPSSSLCDFECDFAAAGTASIEMLHQENIFFNPNSYNRVSGYATPTTNTSSAVLYDPVAHNRSNSDNNNASGSSSNNGRSRDANIVLLNSSTQRRNINVADNNCLMRFMPDVLVRRLVEKWWGPDLQAKKINETATSYMNLNLLDDALKFCNVSLQKSPGNFNSLLLRAEVLRKLCHYQSSLADIDNALRSRSSSAKAHYQRALALSELGRLDEALLDNCLAVIFDKATFLSSSELFKHDLSKLLQKILAQSPKKRPTSQGPRASQHSSYGPYSISSENHPRSKQIGLLANANGDNLSSFHHNDFRRIIVGGDVDHATDNYDYVYSRVHDNNGCGLSSRRHASRKHARRKPSKSPSIDLASVEQPYDWNSYSSKLRDILERTQQEVQRITRMQESSDDGQQGQRTHPLTPVNASLIDSSDFDCVLCCRTFWKPVVTPCGHTYCWVCLDRCMDYSSSCPLCMSPLVEQHVNVSQGSSSPVPFILAKRPVTKFLEAAMKRFIPECYEKRFRQEMDMEPSVPVFICTTAFPHVPCPLFVYEPRYRLMVRRAVESGEKQFGIVQPHNGKSRYFDVGTILDIRDCVLLGDGCSILSTIGCKRFKILARNEKDGYETAKVEYIYDEIITDENVSFVSSMHASVLSKAIEWYDSLSIELKQEILRSFGEMPPVEENWESIADGPAWAWWIIALLPLNQQLKVDILATTSLEKRLRAIEKTLDYMSGTLRRSQQSCVVVQCEGIQPCQAIECCQRTSSSMLPSDETHTNPTGEQPQQLML